LLQLSSPTAVPHVTAAPVLYTLPLPTLFRSGDGVDDIAVGDPFAAGGKGAVHVISGDQAVPVTVPEVAEGDGFGWSVRLAKVDRSEEHTSELQSRENLVCRLLLDKKTTPTVS